MQNDLKIDKYALMKMFQYEHQLQVYMYDFMYVDREAMAEEEYFSDTKTVVENYKNMSTPGPVTIFLLRFGYIHPEYHELDLNFYVTEIKEKSYHTSNDKVKSFYEKHVVVEEEWFSFMNLTGDSTVQLALTKRAKSKLNLKFISHVTQNDAYAKLQ